ncbi:Hemolymph lipopolysaccharide-binding protein [Blattella germanica]|nr:Hemolymph lipopolysaccharide-binding protein [Blattella germanica]
MMMSKLLLYFILLRSGLAYSGYSNLTKFFMSSYRNISGHWMAQVTLDHDGDSGPCEVNLDHTTVPYEKGERVIVFATITVPPLQTGNGYVHLQGFGIYKIHKEKKNWMDAMQTCTKENAHLLIVNSENEFSALKLLGNIEGPYHTSINDLYEEGQFVTQFGRLSDSLNTTGYIKWRPNEPNQGAAGNCVRIFSSGIMADDECNMSYSFICERKLI